MAFEEDDTRDDLVRMLHLFDRFGPFLLGELQIAPILQKAIMQPVLVDSTQFEEQRLVQPFDDFLVALS